MPSSAHIAPEARRLRGQSVLVALFRHFLGLLDQLVDPALGQVQFRHDVLNFVSRFRHLERPGEARVGGIPFSPHFLIGDPAQGGLGGAVMGGGVVSFIHHLVPGNNLMLPVLRLSAKRALPALVPLVAADGLAALADDHAPALADAITVLCAEVPQENSHFILIGEA